MFNNSIALKKEIKTWENKLATTTDKYDIHFYTTTLRNKRAELKRQK